MRTSDRVANYLAGYVTLAGGDTREEIMELFENLPVLFPQWAILSCPIMHPDLEYASPNCYYVLGYAREYLRKHKRLEQFFLHVHEDDQQHLFDCYTFLHDYLETIPPEEHPAYRAITYYRFRKPGGQYIHLHDEKAAITLQGSGNFYYALFQNITSIRPFNGVRIELYKQEGQLKKITEYKPSAFRALLSKREQELVSLIRQGLSTKEIGCYLNISPHTVRNIKSKLFEKYGVSNSIELLNMTA